MTRRKRFAQDPETRALAAMTKDFLPFAEAPEHAATHEQARDMFFDKPTFIHTYQDGSHSVRVQLRGHHIIFGYFKPTDLFSACRYADMVASRIWKFKYKGANPPAEGRLNFHSAVLVEEDFETYENYASVITRILDRLIAVGWIGEDREQYVTPKRASEIALEETRELLALVQNELSGIRAQLADLKKSQEERFAVLSDRLLAGQPEPSVGPPGCVWSAAPLGLAYHAKSFEKLDECPALPPAKCGEDMGARDVLVPTHSVGGYKEACETPLDECPDPYSNVFPLCKGESVMQPAPAPAKCGEGMGAIGTVDQGNSQDAWA